MTDPTPFVRICTRCALRFTEDWRAGCSRCGDRVVPLTAGFNKSAKSRAWKSGWNATDPLPNLRLSKKRREGIANA